MTCLIVGASFIQPEESLCGGRTTTVIFHTVWFLLVNGNQYQPPANPPERNILRGKTEKARCWPWKDLDGNIILKAIIGARLSKLSSLQILLMHMENIPI